MISLVTLTLAALVPLLIYKFLVWNFDYWKKRGVKTAPTKIVVGSFPNIMTQKKHLADDLNDIYKKYKETESFVGGFLMRTPYLIILDPALAHDIYVTSFKHFQDNDAAKLISTSKDPLLANNPFLLVGQDWKEQRALVSPGLTGSRIKVAYSVMEKVCTKLCDYIESESKTAPPEGLNGKELALRFTAENVCDSVLGIQVRSFTKDPVPVGENVKMFSEDNTSFLFYSVLAGLIPNIRKLVKVKFIPKKSEDFFLALMKQAFNMRKQTKVDRQDFMNHLLTLKEKKGLTDNELASHSMTFLIDGLDTTATVISHCLLMLGLEPSTQEKLRQEIIENSDENGELSFEKLNELPYLEACINESLRIYPPGVWAAKTCTEPYTFTNKDGKKNRNACW